MNGRGAKRRAVKPNPKPPVPMKGFFWSAIPPKKIDGTIWDLEEKKEQKENEKEKEKENEKEDEEDKEAVELDLAELQRLFCKAAKIAKKKKKANGTGSGGRKAATKVSLLTPKRTQNLGIALARFAQNGLRVPDIQRALKQLDEENLSSDRLQALLKLMPTSDEIDVCTSFDGDTSSLGTAEKFVLAIHEVPFAMMRIQALLAKSAFSDRSAEVQSSIDAIKTAIGEVRDSKRLVKILRTALEIGNFMNGGTSRGGAYGFHLSSLAKLATTKSSDNKSTLLHFLVSQIPSDGARLSQDIAAVEKASKVSFAELSSAVRNLKKGLSIVSNILSQSEGDAATEKGFSSFQAFSGEVVNDFEESIKLLEEDGAALVKEFGEDPDKISLQEMLSILSTFANQLDSAWETNNVLKMRRTSSQPAMKSAAGTRRTSSSLSSSPSPLRRAGSTPGMVEHFRDSQRETAEEIAQKVREKNEKKVK